MDEDSPGFISSNAPLSGEMDDEPDKLLIIDDHFSRTQHDSSISHYSWNGLQFCLCNEPKKIHSFAYATLPGVIPTPLDWKICCNPDTDVADEHVIYYQLTDTEKSLTDVVKKHCDNRPNVIGLIIINYLPSNFLPDDILKEGIPSQPPIYVVSCENAEQLLDLDSVNVTDGDLKVRVQFESEVDSGASKKELKSIISHGKIAPPYSLHDELKKHLFQSKKERRHIVAEQGPFQVVFSCFQNFEVQPNRESPEKAIKMLHDFKDDDFEQNFLFYLLLAYRFKTYSSMYNSTNVINVYFDHCIEKFESMTDIQGIAETLLSFVGRGNFELQWYHHSKSLHAVFDLLYDMAQYMLTKFVVTTRVARNSVFPRILWISLSIFFGLQCNFPPATLCTTWINSLISEKVLAKQKFSDEVVADFTKGFQFIQVLKLPESVLFVASNLATFLNPLKCKGLHFSHIKKLVIAGVSHLQWGNQVLPFMSPLRCNYEEFFKKQKEKSHHWTKCSDDGTKLGVYKEAIELLKYVYGFLIDKNQGDVGTKEVVAVKVKEFLDLLVDNVDLKAKDVAEYFNALRSFKDFTPTITIAVNLKGVKEMKNLTLSQIRHLLESSPAIWQFVFVAEFLNNCNISSKVSLQDSSWKPLLKIIIEYFPGDNCKNCIVDLLRRISEAYKVDNRQHKFIEDLMALNVPDLLVASADVEVAFINMIHGFVQKYGLQQAIMEQVLMIVDKVKPDIHFQYLLLTAIQEEIIPNVKMIENESMSSSLRELICKSTDSVSKTFSSLSKLSHINKFYWKFIASCCNHIHVGIKDLYKLEIFSFAIERFSNIFLSYCHKRKAISQPLKVIPEDIENISNDNIKEYFRWVIKMQKIFAHWKELLKSKQSNYDDITAYSQSLNTIIAFATCLNVPHLVCEADDIKEYKKLYSDYYDKLHQLLIKRNQDVNSFVTLRKLLSIYGLKVNHTLQTMLDTHLVMPGEDSSGHKADDLQQTLNDMHHHVEFQVIVQLKTSATCKVLVQLYAELRSFVKPILKYLDFLVYFHLHNCELFNKYLFHQIAAVFASKSVVDPSAIELMEDGQSSVDKPDKKFVQFAMALDNTEQFILSLIKGTAKYEDIVTEGSLEKLWPQINIDNEFAIMCAFPKFMDLSKVNEEGKKGIKNMLELFQYCKQITLIPQVCEQYHLKMCINDPKLHELEQIASSINSVEGRANLTGKAANDHMERIREVLHLSDDSKGKRCLKIFPAVSKCADFYQFIKKKGFTGDTNSRSAFISQYRLITSQLQHEDYAEKVLNHLIPAFQYIVPFLDTEQDLTALMEKIVKLFNDGIEFGNNPKKDFCQLETVNSNIMIIQLWFSRTEGDTLENVSKELEAIMNTGHFELVIAPKQVTQIEIADSENDSKVSLYYKPARELYDIQRRAKTISMSESFEGAMPESPQSVQKQVSCSQQVWNREQIDDFVRKLGFLETQKVDEPVKMFQQLNQVHGVWDVIELDPGNQLKIKSGFFLQRTAQNLYHIMLKLRDLGHPDYLKITKTIHCNGKLEDAMIQVADAEKLLKEWKTKVRKLYKDYDKLMFFSVTKVLSLCDTLKINFSAEKVMQGIGFLFRNSDKAMGHLKVAIKSSRDAIVNSTSPQSSEAPLIFVGEYLEHLCYNKSVAEHFLYSRSQPKKEKELLSLKEVVHFAPNYDNGQLLRLLIEIYSGVPESYEVFQCSEESSEEDLKLFLHRVSRFRDHTFTILEVNKLPYKLQELILYHHSQEVKELESGIHLHYIETADSILHEMPWVVVKEYEKTGPNLSWNKANEICEEVVNTGNTNFTLELVYGYAGDGKTHYIKKQLRSPYLIIAVNESFTVLSVISKLRKLPVDKRCAVFFNFTIIPLPSNATPEEQAKYDNLMNTLAWFFFKLFVFGYVEDSETGVAFRLPGGHSWKIFVEVPSHPKENVQDSLDWFCNKIPVFKMIGKPVLVNQTRLYDIDPSVQLVCKYLQAYERRSDNKKGINKLCNDRDKVYEVKFSADPNLTPQECHRLLQKYMQPHVSTSKVLQHLFIKYMERRCKFLECCPGFYLNSGYGEPFDQTKVEQAVLDAMVHEKTLIVVKLNKKQCYYYNTSKLGEVLMETMLQESSEFCKIEMQQNWASQAHQQLIYEVVGGAGSIQLITLKPENLSKAEAKKFQALGIHIPTVQELMKRETFDSYLSSALGIKQNEGDDKIKRLNDIDESHYVLTLDYAVKMLVIHERRECGIPVIIEGETGVGKTALINMLSKLWNHALNDEWKTVKGRIIHELYTKSTELEGSDLKNSLEQLDNQGWNSEKQSQHSQNRCLSPEDLEPLLKLTSQQSDTLYFTFINDYLLRLIKTEPIMELIKVDIKNSAGEIQPMSVTGSDNGLIIVKMIDQAVANSSAQDTAKALCTLLNGTLIPTFYKLNIHAALTPKRIHDFFTPIIKLARSLKKKAETLKQLRDHEPIVTVFLDELNTSSCMGLFKEMIVDKSFEGESLPTNIFLVAACNPHRGNSLAVHERKEDVQAYEKEDKEDFSTKTWFRGSYYVRKLHPTLNFLMWNYGSLNDEQEADYIKAKMIMVNKDFDKLQNIAFSELVVKCQKLIRTFAYYQLQKFSRDVDEAHHRAASCVSQRDIQRVFTFYNYLIKTFETLLGTSMENMNEIKKDNLDRYMCGHPMIKEGLDKLEVTQRALLVSLGLVYYMRLNSEYRGKFVEVIDQLTSYYSVNFMKAYNDEMDFYINKLSLPTGIAKTEALKENLFATIICTATNTPLIIVGAPGSSKTLSFNLTISNLKGPESKEAFFRNTEIFKSLDPHYYQCSRRTTSTEIETIFLRAINRQLSHNNFAIPIRCVVFMDEAGLPEESHESLKVLHYHLDQQEVAFVGITNHVLDAAKTNRAVSLFRPTASHKDLKTLAEGCLCDNPNKLSLDHELENDLKTIVKFCDAYYQVMQDKCLKNFFGLRDFIHFINYIRRKRLDFGSVTPKLVLKSLERNFNGNEKFHDICLLFLEKMGTDLGSDYQPKTIDILRESLADKPYSNQVRQNTSSDDTQNEVRYKLIIDPSEDESITRLLLMFDILTSDNTRTFMCSNFPGDSQLQKINTIAAIRHSAVEGHTVIMSQTDDIHESFYDLFNQHFRRIDDPEDGPRYFANIAIGAHSKPSRVHQNFQCIVVLKESEIPLTPAPFLNRFEKYFISHRNLLELVLNDLPPCLRVMVDSVHEKVKTFYSLLDQSAFYGAASETVSSLLLSVLPLPGNGFKPTQQSLFVVNTTITTPNKKALLLHMLLKSLHELGGFCYMEGTAEELEHDANCIIELLAAAGKQFNGVNEKLNNSDLSIMSKWVAEALELLYTGDAPPEDDEYDEVLGASDEACMVTALVAQSLVRFMCKKLMQLMTPEAIILKWKSIPISYLETYLNFQEHFSIKELITRQIQMLDQCNGKNKVATNIVCYTRSSSLIHQLPSTYPRSTYSTKEELEKSKECIEALIHDQAEDLFLCKLSSVSSQTSFKLQLQDFRNSQQTVFVLVVNMKETERQIVNHIRIMIEEADFSNAQSKKLVVLLLHFPPIMFYEPCYSSLFLYGWDHYYLDTIGQPQQSNKIFIADVRKWLRDTCLSTPQDPESKSVTDSIIDPLSRQLIDLLHEPESIQVLASRILLNLDSTQLSIEEMPSAIVKYDYLQKLLVDKKIGEVLCLKYRSYWKPSVIGSHLEQAASFAKSRESTLSIADSVDSICKTAFFNFIAYMIYQISKSHCLELLSSVHCDDATLDLFLMLLDICPLPKLTEIKAYNNTWDCRMHSITATGYVPRFPFSQEVSTHVDSLIQKNIVKINADAQILQENETSNIVLGLLNKEQMLTKLYGLLCDEIAESLKDTKDGEKHMVAVAIREMQNNEEMWQKYFNDFINQSLHVTAAPGSLEYRLVWLTFADLLNSYSEMKAVAVHCYVYLYQLDLAKVLTSLKTLGQLKVVRDEGSIHPANSEQSLVTSSQASKSIRENSISKYVMKSLFESLINVLYHKKGKTEPLLQEWYCSYRDLMSLSLLKSALITNCEDHLFKAKYHLMETTYLFLQFVDSSTGITTNIASVIALHFCNKFFTSEFQLKGEVSLNLSNAMDSFQLVIESSQFDETTEDRLYQHITDGLFSQFFPESSNSVYCKEDVNFFINYVNEEASLTRELSSDDEGHGCISLSKLKFHLSKILCRGWSSNEATAKPLNFYKLEVCNCIGETVFNQQSESISMKYIPPYIQQIKGSKMLKHLYFYTVLEKMQSKQSSPTQLMSLISTLENQMKFASKTESVILNIERQALIEVLLQHIANTTDEQELKNLLDNSDKINDLIKDDTHYEILLMHLIKEYHNPRRVLSLLSEEKEHWNLNCFIYIRKKLEGSAAHSAPATSHLFPFIVGSQNTEQQFILVYSEICKHLCGILKAANTTKPTKAFVAYVKSINLSSGNKVSCVRTMIWLCVYHEFYCEKRENHKLISLFEKEKACFEFSEEHLHVLRCFLDPTRMVKFKEVPNPTNPNAQRLEITPNGVKPKVQSGNKEDVLWDFFNLKNADSEDPSDTDLRHALANMIAVVFALPKGSNHMWYHMFSPKDLEDTYISGFMYPNRVKKGGLMYDCGCELNEYGQYGRKDYIPHATRGTLSLHSWYLMLLTNFGAFCVGLITQPNALQQISGHILSDWMSIRHYCLTQLRTVWLHMGMNFLCDDEERSYFIMRSMYTLFMSLQDGNFPFLQGKFTSTQTLDDYEKAWHTCVYEPSKTNLKFMLEHHSSNSMWTLPALKSCRALNQQYPHLATENEYMRCLIAAREAHNLDDSYLFALYHFTLEYERLQVGGALLPDLLEFYQWIHVHLSHLVTFEKAKQITIGEVISLSASRYSQELCEHLTKLFKTIIKNYNAYLSINGGIIGEASCEKAAKPTDAHSINEDTPLITLINHDSEDITNYNWLHVVLMHIVESHNSFLSSVFDNAKVTNCHYRKCLPKSPSELHLTEVSNQSSIVLFNGADKQQFMDLVRRCYVYNAVQHTTVIDLEQLEQDVVAFYIAGKPLITSVGMSMVFRFRDLPNEVTLRNNPGCPIDISSVAQELPREFKESLQDNTRKSLEYHFRAASYQTLTEIVGDLRTILGNLIQDILKHEGTAQESVNVQLSTYLNTFNKKEQPLLFHERGIQSITDEQLKSLGDIEMKNLFKCMELFVSWLLGGLYDFSTLPISVFKHMNTTDKEALEQISSKYLSAEEHLLKELDDFEKTLTHAESHLTTKASPEAPIKETLVTLGVCEEDDTLIKLIPDSILTYNYVEFRMTLRKLKLKVRATMESQSQSTTTTLPQWTEIVEDLWDLLPHFQQWYDEDCLKFDCVKLQFADGEESDNDDDIWLEQTACDEKESPATIEETKQVSQMMQQLEENPELKKAMLQKLAPSINPTPASVPAVVEPSKKMTCKELCDWLRAKKIADKYIELFEEEDIDGKELAEYDDKDLQDLGILESRIRKKILVNFKDLM